MGTRTSRDTPEDGGRGRIRIFTKGGGLPTSGDHEIWIEVPLGSEWVGACRLLPRDGWPIVAEVRVFPADDGGVDPVVDRPGDEDKIARGFAEGTSVIRREPGRWSVDERGTDAYVPDGGLTSRLLREVRIPLVVNIARKHLSTFYEEWPQLISASEAPLEFLAFAGIEHGDRHVKRRAHDDRFYAEVAAAYVSELRDENKAPHVALARRWCITRSRARDRVHEARRAGMLTLSPPGKAGGNLTPKAQEILARATDDDGSEES